MVTALLTFISDTLKERNIQWIHWYSNNTLIFNAEITSNRLHRDFWFKIHDEFPLPIRFTEKFTLSKSLVSAKNYLAKILYISTRHHVN